MKIFFEDEHIVIVQKTTKIAQSKKTIQVILIYAVSSKGT